MNHTIKYYDNEKRIDSLNASIHKKRKDQRRKAFNAMFNPLLMPLTQRENDIARAYLFYCMTLHIPVPALVELKADYLKIIKPYIEGRIL